MNFQVQSSGGRIFFVETEFGQIWEIGNGQYMTPVVIEGPQVLGSIPVRKPAAYDAEADRAAVVGTATRVIGERTFVGQFQPDDDQQAVDGHEQGDLNGPGTLTIREKLEGGGFALMIELPFASRAAAWAFFDNCTPAPRDG